AQMALLLVLLLGFHLMGALMFIPPMVSLLKPRFAVRYAEARRRLRAQELAGEAVAARVGAAGGQRRGGGRGGSGRWGWGPWAPSRWGGSPGSLETAGRRDVRPGG